MSARPPSSPRSGDRTRYLLSLLKSPLSNTDVIVYLATLSSCLESTSPTTGWRSLFAAATHLGKCKTCRVLIRMIANPFVLHHEYVNRTGRYTWGGRLVVSAWFRQGLTCPPLVRSLDPAYDKLFALIYECALLATKGRWPHEDLCQLNTTKA